MNELLERAVDGMLSEAEEADLARRLGDDPDLARELVEIARDEALLAETLGRRRTRRVPKPTGFGWFLAGAAAVLLAILAAILFTGGDDLRYDRAQVRDLSGQAAQAVDRGDYERGIALYRQALAVAERHEALKSQAAAIRREIADTEAMRQALAEWTSLKAECERSDFESRDLIREFQARVKAHRERPWKSEVEPILERLEHLYDTSLEMEKASGFQTTRARISKQYLVSEDFAGALAAWREYLGVTKESPKVDAELVRLNLRAREAWDRLMKEAEPLPRDERVKLLEEALPRFRGTDVEAEMRAKIEEWKK